jgi:hypothetical protein
MLPMQSKVCEWTHSLLINTPCLGECITWGWTCFWFHFCTVVKLLLGSILNGTPCTDVNVTDVIAFLTRNNAKLHMLYHHAQHHNEWLSHLSLCKWRKGLSSSGSSLPRELCLWRVAYGLPRLLKPSSSLAPLSLSRLLQKKHAGII